MNTLPTEYLIEHGSALAYFAEQVDDVAAICKDARWVTNMYRGTTETEEVGGISSGQQRYAPGLQTQAEAITELGKGVMLATARASMLVLREEATAYYISRFLDDKKRTQEPVTELVWSDGTLPRDKLIPGVGSHRMATKTFDDGRVIRLNAVKLEKINDTDNVAYRSRMWLEEGDISRSLSVMVCADEVYDVDFETTIDDGEDTNLKLHCISWFKGAASNVISILSGDYDTDQLEEQLDALRSHAPRYFFVDETEGLLDLMRDYAMNQFEGRAVKKQLGGITLPTMDDIDLMITDLQTKL